MTSSSSSTGCCFNLNCREGSEKWRRGWPRRTGDYAHLCDRCASAYEEGNFCETFHLDASGWRNCESCGKEIHCGCIVSFHMFVLLDAGGIECLTCAKKSNILPFTPAIQVGEQVWNQPEDAAPVVTVLPPPIFEESEVSSPASNQSFLHEARLDSLTRSPLRPEVTNDQLQTAINNLFALIQRTSSKSQDTSKVLSSLRQTLMEEINLIRQDFVRQYVPASAVYNLSSQLARMEQRLDAKIDSIGTQLTEIISFLAHVDDKKGEETGREAGRVAVAEEPRRRSATDEEHFRRQMDEERRRL